LLNCYAQASQTKGPVEIVGTPGVVTHRVLEGQGRGFAVLQGTLYVVAGDTLYDVLSGADKGTIPGTSRLTFAATKDKLVTDTGHVFDGTTLAALSDPDVVPMRAVGYSDGRVVAVEAQSQNFVCSGYNDDNELDAEFWDALEFSTADGAPDNLLTLVVCNRDIHLLGATTSEEWWNAGNSGFPYERKAGGFREIGVAGRLAAVKADNTVFMIASDRTARVLRGSTWVKVSQTGVEEAFSGYSTLADCEATSYTWNGNVFVSFLFPTANACWVFNVTTSEWFERDPTWAAVIEHNGKVWVQHLDGSVGYLSDAAYGEFGEAVIREVTFPNIYADNARATHSQIDFIFRTGDAPVGITPYAQLDISDDGGNTWVSLPHKAFGLTGHYRHVVRWTRLGQARDRVYRVRVSDSVPFHLVSTELDVQAGAK
jgi:hypothetical protein